MESMLEISETLSSIMTSEATGGVFNVGNFLGGAVKAAKRFCSVVLGTFSRASCSPNLAKSLILMTSLAKSKIRLDGV